MATTTLCACCLADTTPEESLVTRTGTYCGNCQHDDGPCGRVHRDAYAHCNDCEVLSPCDEMVGSRCRECAKARRVA